VLGRGLGWRLLAACASQSSLIGVRKFYELKISASAQWTFLAFSSDQSKGRIVLRS